MKKLFNKVTCFCVTALTAISASLCLFGNSPATAAADEDFRYYDAPGVSTCAVGDTETITFARKEEEFIELTNGVPYYYVASLDNACGPIAGGIVVGYYDKYFEDLIPNYTGYYAATGKYKRADNTHVPAMISSLYTLMRTNVDDVGVSRSDCLAGLSSYVDSKNLDLTYTTVKAPDGSFNETVYKTAINNGQPTLLFCYTVELLDLALDDTQDWVGVIQTGSAHVMVAFGYRKIQYYDANNNNFRTDTYLKVASGWSANNMGYVKINNNSWLTAAYVAYIH